MDHYECEHCHRWREESEMDALQPTLCRFCALALEHQADAHEPMVRWLYDADAVEERHIGPHRIQSAGGDTL